MTDLTLGMAAGLGTGMTWAATSILVHSLSGVISPVGISAVRATAGGAILIVIAVLTGHASEMVQMPLWVVLALGGSIIFAMGIGDCMYFHSMDQLGVTRALILGMANPLLTTLIGILLGERVTWLRMSGIFLVVGGLVLIIAGKGGGEKARPPTRRGLRLIMTAAFAWAASATMMKPAVEQVSATAASAIRLPLGALFLWLTPWTRDTMRAIAVSSREQRLRLGAICVLSAFTSLFFAAGIKFGGVAIGNVLSSTAPFFTLPFEIWVLGQRPSRGTVLGAVVTVAGVGLMNC